MAILAILKSKYFIWTMIILLGIKLFVSWRQNVEKTKQAKELTLQLQEAYANPKVEIIEVEKVKVVQGKTKIVEKIVYVTGTETKTEERTIETDPTIIEKGEEKGTLKEPILPQIQEKNKRYCILTSYYPPDDTMTIGVGTRIWKLDVGVSVKMQDFKNPFFGGFITVDF